MEEKKIVNIPVEDILPNRFQPRLAFDEKELNDLSNSILKYGIIQPIVLRKMGDKYEIIAGERRYKATVLAGLKTIPAIINEADDNTSAEIALLENLQRKNLTVIEEAQSFKKLIDKGFTQEDIAAKLGISQSSIANKIRLLGLPKKVQDALLYNKISERHARSLLSLNDENLQKELLDRIVNEKLTVRQTEDEISRILNKNAVKEDIPETIKTIIEPEIPKTNVIIETDKEESKVENNVPEVVNIEEKDSEEINPFQMQFRDNIRKIEEQIQNQRESYYDNIIRNDIKDKFNNIEEQNDTHESEIIDENNKKDENLEILNFETKYNKPLDKVEISGNINLPKTINEIRNFVKNMENGEKITLSELDLIDKYQIIIEIDKDE